MTLVPRMEVLPAAQREVWPLLEEFKEDFVLYGGTAIALRVGRRTSVDFDLFSGAPLDPAVILRSARCLQGAEVLQMQPNTLTVSLANSEPVKLSLFGDLSIGRVADPELTEDGVVRVASAIDLLGTKLKVLLQRVEIKDYLDIAALLGIGLTLEEGLGCARALYGSVFPPMECVKALTYFEERPVRELDDDTQAFLENRVASWSGEIATIERVSDSPSS